MDFWPAIGSANPGPDPQADTLQGAEESEIPTHDCVTDGADGRVEDRSRQTEGMSSVLGSTYANHDLVFCQTNGKPLHARHVSQRDFRSVATRADVPHIRFHDLRHCSATLLLREGVHPKVVQERLGRSGISVTMDTYSHVLPGIAGRCSVSVSVASYGS